MGDLIRDHVTGNKSSYPRYQVVNMGLLSDATLSDFIKDLCYLLQRQSEIAQLSGVERDAALSKLSADLKIRNYDDAPGFLLTMSSSEKVLGAENLSISSISSKISALAAKSRKSDMSELLLDLLSTYDKQVDQDRSPLTKDLRKLRTRSQEILEDILGLPEEEGTETSAIQTSVDSVSKALFQQPDFESTYAKDFVRNSYSENRAETQFQPQPQPQTQVPPRSYQQDETTPQRRAPLPPPPMDRTLYRPPTRKPETSFWQVPSSEFTGQNRDAKLFSQSPHAENTTRHRELDLLIQQMSMLQTKLAELQQQDFQEPPRRPSPASVQIMHTVPAPSLPVFYGDPDKDTMTVSNFCKKFLAVAAMYGPADHMILYLESSLQGNALNWFRYFTYTNPQLDLSSILSALRAQFGSLLSPLQRFRHMEARTQQPQEPMQAYFTDKLRLLAVWNTDINDKDMCVSLRWTFARSL